jgi:hypothetical protein
MKVFDTVFMLYKQKMMLPGRPLVVFGLLECAAERRAPTFICQARAGRCSRPIRHLSALHSNLLAPRHSHQDCSVPLRRCLIHTQMETRKCNTRLIVSPSPCVCADQSTKIRLSSPPSRQDSNCFTGQILGSVCGPVLTGLGKPIA